MASQMYSVTNNRKLVPNQSADLNARLQGLPNLMQLQQQRRQFIADEQFRQEQLAQEKSIARKNRELEREQDKQGFGLEMAKMGVNIGTGALGKTDTTFNDWTSNLGSKNESTYSGPPGKLATTYERYSPGTPPPGKLSTTVSANRPQGKQATMGATMENPDGTFTTGGNTSGKSLGFFGNLQPSGLLAGGLSGYGLSSMFAGRSTDKKLLYGALGGALTGLLSNGWGGMMSGGIGGLFGGLAA